MPMVALAEVGREELRRNWGWFVVMGVVLALLGLFAMGRACTMTIVSTAFFGWLMVAGGVLEVLHATWKGRGWGGFFIDLVAGTLYVVFGFLVATQPVAAAVTLTLLLAGFLMAGGIFRIVVVLAVRFPHWPLQLLHGVIMLLLGISIWRQWPISGLWVIGLFIGIEMLLHGTSLVALGLAARRLPASAAAAA